MFWNVFQTEQNYAVLFLRLALAVAIFPHGAQKLLGWFGGFGYKGTMGYFTQTLGIPTVFGFLAIVAEFFGSLALIAGFLFPALGITLTLGGGVLGAIILAFIGAVILLVIVRLFKQIAA